MCESVNPFSFHKTLNYVIYKSCGRVSIFGDLGLCCSKESCYHNRGWWTNQKFEVVSYIYIYIYMYIYIFFWNKLVLL